MMKLSECPVCNGDVIEVEKDILIKITNPGEVVVNSSCFECQQCGEELLDEKQAGEFARKLDAEILKHK